MVQDNHYSWLACRYCHFLMDAAGDRKPCDYQKVLKELGLQETRLAARAITSQTFQEIREQVHG